MEVKKKSTQIVEEFDVDGNLIRKTTETIEYASPLSELHPIYTADDMHVTFGIGPSTYGIGPSTH